MIAATAQLPLFSRRPVAIMDEEAFDVHALSIPARTFTGDFYFTHRAVDRLCFAVGDVAGKGLPAALVMAMIQEELEHRITSCALAGCDPTTTMQRLHAFLRPLLPQNRFATVVIGWLCEDGTLVLVNGGHCPPLIARAGSGIERVG
ncbi:MAG: PP2C family protein-serine/threonine phosphatase, partial [Candidatus Dormibacteria bacterium]